MSFEPSDGYTIALIVHSMPTGQSHVHTLLTLEDVNQKQPSDAVWTYGEWGTGSATFENDYRFQRIV